MPARKLTPLTPGERGEIVQRIRFELGVKRGRKVTLAEFGDLVSELAGLDRVISHATVIGWEKGAEPGFLAGCAIAHLGGLPAEALAFKQASGMARPSTASLIEPAKVPIRQVAERPSFPLLKGHPVAATPSHRKKKGA